VSGLASAEAWLQQNKPLALGVAGAGVVGAALYARKRSAVSSGRGAATGQPDPTPFSAGGQVPIGGYAMPDSSASDLYGSLAPELASIADNLNGLQQQKDAKPPTPVPAKPANNAAWLNAAVGGWAGAGKNAIDLQYALNRYLQGQSINQAQTFGINWAVKNYGAPPQGTKGTSVVSKPAPAKKK
jgi:hypothetical protein